MWIPQAPPKGYDFDPEATDSPDYAASLSRWSFCFWKILYSAHSRPFRVSTGCGLKVPQHLIWATHQVLHTFFPVQKHTTTQQLFWACLCVLKSFQICGTTILSYHHYHSVQFPVVDKGTVEIYWPVSPVYGYLVPPLLFAPNLRSHCLCVSTYNRSEIDKHTNTHGQQKHMHGNEPMQDTGTQHKQGTGVSVVENACAQLYGRCSH